MDSLQRLKDVLSEVECKQQAITGGLSDPSKVEKALQQTKVILTFTLKQGSCLFCHCHPLLSVPFLRGRLFSEVMKILLSGKSAMEQYLEAASACLCHAVPLLQVLPVALPQCGVGWMPLW